MLDLQPMSQDTKQQMARQTRGGFSPEHRAPSGSESVAIEATQTRDLDGELMSIRRCRTDRCASHVVQALWRPDRAALERGLSGAAIR
jgi:hypothetical protein